MVVPVPGGDRSWPSQMPDVTRIAWTYRLLSKEDLDSGPFMGADEDHPTTGGCTAW
jgi:hypothetical protein